MTNDISADDVKAVAHALDNAADMLWGLARRMEEGKAPPWVSEAAEMYENGTKLSDIGRKVGAAATTVRKHLLRHGVEMRPKGPRKGVGLKIDVQRAKEMYGAGWSYEEIAQDFDCSRQAVQQILVANGVESRPSTPRPSVIDGQRVVEMYQDGLGLGDIATRLHCGIKRVRETLVSNGVQPRPPGRPRKTLDATP